MATQLSGITVVYLMAIGFQLFVILFIFAKRQIMRFARSSRKEPHVAIGTGCKDTIKASIQGNIAAVASLDVLPSLTRHLSLNTQTSSYWYRLKTLDDLRLLDAELDHSRCPYRRRSIEPLSTFLGRLTHLGLTFNGETVFHLCRLVESARFSRLPYGEVEYREFATLLNEILAVVKRNRHQLKKVAQSESNFPIKTELVLQSKPVIRTRLQNILYKDKSETLL